MENSVVVSAVQMNSLPKYGLVALFGMSATLCLLSFILIVVLGTDISAVVQKANSHKAIYIFPVLIFLEFCCLVNDLLVHLANRFGPVFAFQFREVQIKFDQDNFDVPIPLRTKLLKLYPLSIGLTTLGFALVLITR